MLRPLAVTLLLLPAIGCGGGDTVQIPEEFVPPPSPEQVQTIGGPSAAGAPARQGPAPATAPLPPP